MTKVMLQRVHKTCGVSENTIRRIRARETWAHVE